MRSYIKRNDYWNKIKPYIGAGLIKVIVGQRRVGKSYLLKQIRDEFEVDKKKKVLYIDKERVEYDNIVDYKDLLKRVEDYFGNRNGVLLIDEVQEIEGFEKGLRHVNNGGKIDIYVTGSNAQILSSDLANKFGGRYQEIEMYGLAYKEFLKFNKLLDSKEALEKYLRYGGLPYLKNLEMNDEVVYGYLRGIFDSALLSDVVSRNQIRNVGFLDRLIEFVAQNIGCLVSAKRVSDFLVSQKSRTSANVVLNYLKKLEDSYLIYKCKRIDIIGRKIFEINDKYYFNDLGIRNMIVGYKQIDYAKILENVVFLHLKRLGYTVGVGTIEGKEVDFVAEKGGKIVYIQVAYKLDSKETMERETRGLLDIKDNYKKMLVVYEDFKDEFRGIEIVGVRDFLKGGM